LVQSIRLIRPAISMSFRPASLMNMEGGATSALTGAPAVAGGTRGSSNSDDGEVSKWL
jgi:hypothetical protein